VALSLFVDLVSSDTEVDLYFLPVGEGRWLKTKDESRKPEAA
jgi:hypothetical protein